MIQEEGVKMEKLVERFLTYVKVNTRSDANSQTTPTTVGQVVLAKMIETELHELGLAVCIITNKTAFNGTVAW